MKIIQQTIQFSFLILCSALASSIQAQSVASGTSRGALDFAQIRRDLAVFQGVLDTTLKQSLPGPFQILGSSKGTYLPDYGAVFSLEANVYQIRRLSPFDMKPHTEKELNDAYNQMMTRVEMVKELIIRAMAEHGSALRQLGPDENLTVIAHLFTGGFNGASDSKREFPSQLVFSVKESIISEFRESKVNLDEFSKSVKLLQF
jgi:hypothetical protein